jgi:hypothetical protein
MQNAKSEFITAAAAAAAYEGACCCRLVLFVSMFRYTLQPNLHK